MDSASTAEPLLYSASQDGDREAAACYDTPLMPSDDGGDEARLLLHSLDSPHARWQWPYFSRQGNIVYRAELLFRVHLWLTRERFAVEIIAWFLFAIVTVELLQAFLRAIYGTVSGD